ncbi:protein SSUH2 homolog [Hyperolius riggenbachi]|uniref:protein SSUH2 homolog n=1 Tax=Hyperolius riggenbachi TaxID=752182 RepID=UPI0035A2DB37
MSKGDLPGYGTTGDGGNAYHFAASNAGLVPDAPVHAIPVTADDFPMTILPGYEAITSGQYDGMFEPPPPYTPHSAATAPLEEIRLPPPYVSEDVARKVFMEYGSKVCCFSSKAAREMVFQNFHSLHTYRYCLETFTEYRKCKWVTVPYYGETIDGPANGPAPKPWEIPVVVPRMFQDGKHKLKVPHTSRLEVCSLCMGVGRKPCAKCFGIGRANCIHCGGTGRRSNEQCNICHGMGRPMCTSCVGSGFHICATCGGQGRLLKYISLTVKWKNDTFRFVADHTSEFPSKYFKDVSGEVIYSDEQLMLPPIAGFPDPAINEASEKALSQHRNQLDSCQILRQRHSIEWLPLTKVEYTWKNKHYDFFVFGKEHKVNAKKYPSGCGCAIM